MTTINTPQDLLSVLFGDNIPEALKNVKTFDELRTHTLFSEQPTVPSGTKTNEENIILLQDSYKYSQFNQYPQGTQYVYSYIESRGGRWDETVWFGGQILIKKYLMKPITKEMIDEAEELITKHGLPFNRAGWEYILEVHKGRLPIRIKSAKEGAVVPTHNVLLTIENTDPACYWLVSFLETCLLRAAWYGTTVATNSWQCKQIIKKYLEQTCDNPTAELPFKLHDFGCRGVSSNESAGIGGAAHLVNFMGTDTVAGLVYARNYYGCDMAGYSVPAMEHSTVTSWGRHGEADSYRNMLKTYGKPGGIVSAVSDSYDIYHATREIWGNQLRDEVIASGATLVIRPDSGDPTRVPVELMEIVADTYGYTVNNKGFKVLKNVRILQGDGMNINTIAALLENIMQAGFSTENVVVGMGGKLLQADIDRDTQKFAMKCSAICVNGEWRDVYKDPITDSGKRSKRGKLALIREDGHYETVPLEGNAWRDELVEIYRDGDLLRDWTFDEIRALAAA